MEARFAFIPKKHILLIFGLVISFLSSPASFAAPLKSAHRFPFTAPGKITFQPQAVHFENAVVGQAYMQTVVLTNNGRSPVGIWNVWGNNPRFRFRGLKLPLKLTPGQSVTAEVDFVPTRAGQLGAYFTVTTSHRRVFVLRADGNLAGGGLVALPGRVNFGSLQVGAAEGLPITIVNYGAASRTISQMQVAGMGFGMTQRNLPITLTPGESVTFNATFAPPIVGAATGRIIAESAGSGLAVALTGQGSEAGQLSAVPAQLDFGNVQAGTSALLSGILQAGKAPVTIYSAGISSAEFGLNGLSFPLTIPAGQSVPYQVRFAPALSGSTSGVLSFRTASGSIATEALSGNAVPRKQHRVTLSWNAASSDVSGYNVFRAEASGGGYSQLNSIPDSITSYLDSTVQGGHTYYYVTTAVATTGKQSAFSNQVVVSIPQ